jgi:hypothetical protein
MYKLVKCSPTQVDNSSIFRISDGMSIPFNLLNLDFVKFKNDIQGIGEFGESITPVELQDAEGNVMTAEEVSEFIATLP